MIGKCDGGVGGNHSFGCARALSSEIEKILRVVTSGVVIAEAVERNQDHVGFRQLPRSVRSVVDGNHGRDCLRLTTRRSAHTPGRRTKTSEPKSVFALDAFRISRGMPGLTDRAMNNQKPLLKTALYRGGEGALASEGNQTSALLPCA